MRHNRRIIVSEINLAPLLDVLFSILFIVMMTGTQNEQDIEKEYQEQVSQLEQENKQLSRELARSENQMTSYNQFQSEAVILTVNNTLRGDNHYLLVYKGTDKEEIGCIQMGINCQTAHCRRRKPHFDFGGNTSPIVPYRHLPQTLCGLTADCRSLV